MKKLFKKIEGWWITETIVLLLCNKIGQYIAIGVVMAIAYLIKNYIL